MEINKSLGMNGQLCLNNLSSYDCQKKCFEFDISLLLIPYLPIIDFFSLRGRGGGIFQI